MADNTENLILEHLKGLRNELKEFRQETREELQTIKLRLNSVERGFAGTHDDNVTVQLRLDRVDNRIDRIEKRLELTGS
jgi:chromosome segregation ATPase